jgi:hypothetical protein
VTRPVTLARRTMGVGVLIGVAVAFRYGVQYEPYRRPEMCRGASCVAACNASPEQAR